MPKVPKLKSKADHGGNKNLAIEKLAIWPLAKSKTRAKANANPPRRHGDEEKPNQNLFGLSALVCGNLWLKVLALIATLTMPTFLCPFSLRCSRAECRVLIAEC